MQGHSTVRLKDHGVAVGFVVLTVVAFVFIYKSARDRHELERMREQNRLLSSEIRRLETSFSTIRTYTRSADDLAAAGVKPSQLRQRDDLGLESAATEGLGVFGRMSLAARNGAGGTITEPRRSDLESFTRTLTTVEGMTRETDSIVRRLRSLATVLKYNKDLMRGIPSLRPAEGRVTSDFGMRLSPFEGKRHMHAGVDLAALVGTPVKAAADGTVTFAGDFELLGRTMVITHPSGMLTRYGHLQKYLVAEGAVVKRGQTIALVGNSGRSTGPHLHYEVWVRNVAVNPKDFFFDITDKPAPLTARKETATPLTAPIEDLSGVGGDE